MKNVSWAAPLAALVFALAVPAAELELVQTIQLKGKAGGLDHLALDAKRERLFVANKTNNTLDIVDLKEGKLLEQKPNQTAIQGIAYVPDLDRVFVGLGSNGLCNAFDGEKYKILKTINFKDDADNVRYNPVAKVVYVAHAEKALGVIDPKTFAKKADIKLPAAAEGFASEIKRPRLYLVTPSPSQLVVIDTDKNEVVTTHAIKSAAGGHPVALDEANHRVFVGCHKEPMVVVIDTENGKEIATVHIPGDVDDLFHDAKSKRLYASCGEGALVVIEQQDADTYKVVEKLDTPKGARTCLYVAETGRLYLAVPRQEGKEGPEIRVYQAKQ
ncbi:MAG TPA: YncE family protein [Gemmataceae bacterium]|nr:YncE family protein [Gemmataceae bacterium]